MIIQWKADGTAKILAAPAVRGRVLASVAAAAPVAAAVAAAEVKTLNDIANDADREAYSKAYKMIGRLMAGTNRSKGMPWPKALAKVQQETGWTVRRTTAFKSKRARGKVVPTPQGRPLYMGEEAEKTMVRSVQALRSMRLPARKHIVINMATNMVKSAGLGMALDETAGKVPDHWFYRFKNRHADLFDFSSTRGLEDVRAKWLTSGNALTHYQLLADQFIRAGIALEAEGAERLAGVVNGETIEFVSEKDKARIVSFDECRSTLDTYEDEASGKQLEVKGGTCDTELVRGLGNVTVVCGSRGDGKALPPLVIFPRKTMGSLSDSSTWNAELWRAFARDSPVSEIIVGGKRMPAQIIGNKSGGMTHDLGAVYLREIIAPCVPGRTKEKPGIVICDGHGSHLTLEMLQAAVELNFIILLRPPHTTSRLQGEDTKHGFGTFQSNFRTEKTEVQVARALTGGGPLCTIDYMRVMKVAYERAFTRENCRKSWDKIGVIPFTRRVYWELAAEERHRAELKAKSEKMGSAEVVEKLQEMDAKSIVAAGEAARAAAAAAAAHSDSGDDDGDSDGNGSDSDGPVEKQLTSTLAWKKPANARANVKRMEKRARQLEAAANKRKRKEEEKEKAARKAKRQNTTEGQRVQAELLAAEAWVPAFNLLTISAMTALGMSLGMKKVPKSPKSAVADAVKPIVQEWMDARPPTRAGTVNDQ
eukprot:g3308.t1